MPCGSPGWSRHSRFRSCDSGADRASAKVCRVSLVAAHQVRHELALIAVGRLAVADIHCC
ncbi:Ms4533A family Cys-rich leader peptide [Prescottella agglutinans]|uniref:Ms4533A family Cys-rich leader peptide n=1 Tax=Prescottella agglutinans TaxID=1644129 RepID=UPI003CC8BBE0